jgi:hypothetical protein
MPNKLMAGFFRLWRQPARKGVGPGFNLGAVALAFAAANRQKA